MPVASAGSPQSASPPEREEPKKAAAAAAAAAADAETSADSTAAMGATIQDFTGTHIGAGASTPDKGNKAYTECSACVVCCQCLLFLTIYIGQGLHTRL